MKKQLIITTIAAIVAVSCTKGETVKQSSRFAINFETHLSKNTKGVPNMGVSFPNGSTMGVFATKTGSSTNDIMNNQEVTKDPTIGWIYSPTKFFDKNSSYTFNAYSPYINDGAVPSETAITNYEVSTDISKQVDLMYSDEVNVTTDDQANISINGSPAENIKFIFKHALSQVKFSAKLKSASAEGEIIRAKGVQINGINSKGTLTILTDTWSELNTPVNYITGPSSPVELNNSAMTLIGNTAGNILMLLPQTGSSIKVYFAIEIQKGGTTTTQNIEVTISSINWSRNNIYHYQITIDNTSLNGAPIEFGEPIIEEWDNSEKITPLP